MKNTITLANGVKMPHIGMGTYPMMGQELNNSVMAAYNAGYRLFDTADNYYNENDLGDSLLRLYKQTGACRKELFLCSKVSDELYPPSSVGGGMNRGVYFWKSSPIMQQPNSVHKIIQKKIEDTLKYLHTDYLDLYLLHWPYPDYFIEMWYELEQLYKKGVVRAIGVCNCRERHFEKLRNNCEIMPMINQLETSPLNTKNSILNYSDLNNIRTMVYSPLMTLKRNDFAKYQKTLLTLAANHNVNAAQIILRFNIQRGLIPIPKSTNPSRLKENISIFDFELPTSEMNILSSFNCDLQCLPESKSCPGL